MKKTVQEGSIPVVDDSLVSLEKMDALVAEATKRCERAETDVVDARQAVKYAATEEEKDDAQLAIANAQKEQRDALRAVGAARAARARVRAQLRS